MGNDLHQGLPDLVCHHHIAVSIGSRLDHFLPQIHAVLAVQFRIIVIRQGSTPVGAIIQVEGDHMSIVGVDAILILLNVIQGDIAIVNHRGSICCSSLIYICLGIHDLLASGVERICTVVTRYRIQQKLCGFHKILGLDGGTVLPAQVIPEGKAPGPGSLAFFDAVLSHILVCHIGRLCRSHAGHQRIARLVLVVIKHIESIRQITQHIVSVCGCLIDMGIPVGRTCGKGNIISILILPGCYLPAFCTGSLSAFGAFRTLTAFG